MTKRHDQRGKRADRVAEPVQVYLAPADRERLERLAARLNTSKSEVLRQGLAALDASTQRGGTGGASAPALPRFKGQGLQAGVDLDDTASLLDLMDGDAPR
jgi:hypothetical protein